MVNKEYTGKSNELTEHLLISLYTYEINSPKRCNFINIQNSQTTHCLGYTPSPVRTGYERVLAHRTDELYAKTARTSGKVTNLTAQVITVTYDDGEVVNYEIGRRFGTWAGHTIPHDIRTDLKLGETVKANDPIVYNEQYFVKDTLDPKQVIYKQGVLARVVLWESPDTLEDSSAITDSLSKKLATQQTEIRCIKVPFDNEVRNLVKVGERLSPDSILCRLHPKTEGNNDLFDEDSMALLDTLSSSSPRAKLTGIVDKIEVLYTGDLDDMSTTLRTLTEKSDSEVRRFNKQMGKRAVDGYVEPMFRVGGTPMESNTAMIKLFITTTNGTGVGDKLVYANQLKSVIGRVMYGVNKSKDGKPIDAIFGYLSIQNRIVLSPELVGSTSTLLVELGERFCKAYEGS